VGKRSDPDLDPVGGLRTDHVRVNGGAASYSFVMVTALVADPE
jgi:hypothetical protein